MVSVATNNVRYTLSCIAARKFVRGYKAYEERTDYNRKLQTSEDIFQHVGIARVKNEREGRLQYEKHTAA